MKFNLRGFTSILLTFCFVLITFTGLVLYIVPPGRVANWTNWTLFGLSKPQWSAVHTLFSFVFVAAGVFHLMYNWRALLSYLKDRVTKTYRLKAELLSALVITVIVGIGAILALPPFGTVMTVGESIKESWETDSAPAPSPHTELLTLEEVTNSLGMQTDRMLMKLERNGIIGASLDMSLQDIAAQNNTSPSELYAIIQQRGEGNGDH